MKKKKIRDESLRKEIGLRFKEFRNTIKKSQYKLAEELKSSQSTITKIEIGKLFPGAPLQNYLHRNYHLNLNWLLTGEGEMNISPAKKSIHADLPILFWHISDDEPRFELYVELISLMRIPYIEEIILAKLAEIKVIAKDEIKSFFEET